jgi:small subunit ribosomal protein S19e
MGNARDVDPEKLILSAAAEMGKMEEFRPPAWSSFAKTGVSRQRPPEQDNWWQIRAAAILRKLYMNEGMGVSRLRVAYGGRKNRGHKPEHSYKASGSVIRKALQQLEKAGFVKAEKGRGRVITSKGRKFLNHLAGAK